MTSKTDQYIPSIGEIVKDDSRGRLGEARGNEGPYWQLRPIGGGREWDVRPESIRKADPLEVLSEKNALQNRRSRKELA